VSAIELSVDELLTTTRAVRKRLDMDRPVEMSAVRECLEIALQAPSGSNAQGWHFIVVRDAEKRQALAELYEKAFNIYRDMPISAHALAGEASPEDQQQMERVGSSAEYLAANLARVPVHLIPCIEGRLESDAGDAATLMQASVFGSIIPAAWSFMLAARSRGLGTAWTTLHLMFEKAAAEILGVPYEKVTQIALIPVAYYTGTTFRVAKRKPLDDVLHVDSW